MINSYLRVSIIASTLATMEKRRVLSREANVSASLLCLGTLPFGTTVGEDTAFALLDRFLEAGGTAIDTANNYAFWVDGATGDESEELIGRWVASRRARDRVIVGSKCGARPRRPGAGLDDSEGLSPSAIRRACESSLCRLRTDRIDIYWAHWEDRSVPLEETVGAFGELVAEGKVRLLGLSNHRTWRIERARALARAAALPDFVCVQNRHSYIVPRPGAQLPEWAHVLVGPDLIDYARSETELTIFAYSTLLSGAYTRADKPVPEQYDHPGTTRRLAALRDVAADLGATPNQVVLAWLIGGDPPVVPIIGATSVSQLEENLGAFELELDAAQRARLDTA